MSYDNIIMRFKYLVLKTNLSHDKMRSMVSTFKFDIFRIDKKMFHVCTSMSHSKVKKIKDIYLKLRD